MLFHENILEQFLQSLRNVDAWCQPEVGGYGACSAWRPVLVTKERRSSEPSLNVAILSIVLDTDRRHFWDPHWSWEPIWSLAFPFPWNTWFRDCKGLSPWTPPPSHEGFWTASTRWPNQKHPWYQPRQRRSVCQRLCFVEILTRVRGKWCLKKYVKLVKTQKQQLFLEQVIWSSAHGEHKKCSKTMRWDLVFKGWPLTTKNILKIASIFKDGLKMWVSVTKDSVEATTWKSLPFYFSLSLLFGARL